jgi:hypothetical protein
VPGDATVAGLDLASGPDATAIAEVRDAQVLRVLDRCEDIPDDVCDAFGATCGTCPGYATWRATLSPRGWA